MPAFMSAHTSAPLSDLFCLWLWLGCCAAWQPHRKHRALARLACHGHVAAHHARELAGESKSQPRPTIAACGQRICLGEVLEQFLLLLGGHADAAVRDGKLDPVATIRYLRTRSATSPSFVNLQALLKRLSRICFSRMGSALRAPRFSCASTVRRFLFFSASCPAVPMTSLISGVSCTVCGLSSSFPASIFDRSSTWL